MGLMAATVHINVLDPSSWHFVIFLPRLQWFHVIVGKDSTVLAAYVNKQGGLGLLLLCRIAARLKQ